MYFTVFLNKDDDDDDDDNDDDDWWPVGKFCFRLFVCLFECQTVNLQIIENQRQANKERIK